AFNAQSAAQTMSAPALDHGGVDPTAKTVPMMDAVQANALGATVLGDSMMPGGFGLYAAQSSGPVATMASILEPPSAELTGASGDADGPTTERVSITQLARSKNATEVPPPSVLPNVEADLPVETARQMVASTMRPVADTTAAAVPQARNSIGASNDQPFDLKTRWNQAAAQQTRTSTMMSMHAVRGPAPQPRPQTKTTSADTQADMAAVHPESDSSFRAAEVYAPLASLAQPSFQPGTLSVRVPRTDYAATEARQQAVMFAVNQMTLRRAVADGELDIPELGKVRVDAQTKNGEVEVKITAEREDTRTLVNAHAQAIALDARTAAIPIANIHVEGADKNAGAQTSFSGSNNGPKDEQKQNDFGNKAREITPGAKPGETKARFVL
ncbi:MAG: flagellar hook-length control protein FliK, partial [Polyangiaceae bacterium]